MTPGDRVQKPRRDDPKRPPSMGEVVGEFEAVPAPPPAPAAERRSHTEDSTDVANPPKRRHATPEPTLFPDDTGPQGMNRKARLAGDTDVPRTTGKEPRRFPLLVILDGRRVSERFVLRQAEAVAGRDADVAILLTDGEVSRQHAVFHWSNHDDPTQAPECFLEDLGSTNGTFLNSRHLRPGIRRPLNDGDQVRMGRTVLGFFIKDERLLEMDDMLLAMALHDALTGVYKREFFLSELHREFERARRHRRPLALVLLDIDHFKRVNDDLGHVAGDDALRQVANIIRVGLREGDLCGRYGGEEFAVLLPETDLLGARQAAERIRHDIDNYSFKLTGGHTRRITLSAGVALLAPSMKDKVDLIDAADKLLYRAKQGGRNRVEA